MTKKNKDDAPNLSSVPNRDIIQRLNFLYQASTYLNELGVVRPRAGPSNVRTRLAEKIGSCEQQEEMQGCEEEDKDVEKESAESSSTQKTQKMTAHDLARSYVKSMKVIGQKTNVKMDPSVKRTLCKGCNALLIPGVTAKIRVKPLPSHEHAVHYTCMNCSVSRRIPAPPTAVEQPYRPSSSQHGREVAKTSDGMDVDPVRQQGDALLNTVLTEPSTEARKQLKPHHRSRRKRLIKPRPVPFFARAKHVLYVGNDRVLDAQENDAK